MTSSRVLLTALIGSLLHITASNAAPVRPNFVYTSAFGVYYDDGEKRLVDENEGPRAYSKVFASTDNLSISSTSYAGIGFLKTRSSASNGPDAGQMAAVSTAEWQQSVTFTNAALTGQKGYTTLKHYFSVAMDAGSLGEYASGSSVYTTGIGFSKGLVGDTLSDYVEIATKRTVDHKDGTKSAKQQYAYGGAGRGMDDYWQDIAKPVASPENYLYLPIEFVWGQTYTVFAKQSTVCFTNTFGYGAGNCYSDSSHSAYWGGIGEIRNDAGAVVNDFALITSGGDDFTHSLAPAQVPEPGSVALAFAGLGMALLARRRSRKGSTPL